MHNNDYKIPVYFIPGLAAGIEIFEFIKLSEANLEIYYLEWLLPISNDESLENYAERLSNKIKHNNPILIGVSFGGILAQEISKIIPIKKVILISSVKNRNEFPKRLIWIQKTQFYRLFPLKSIINIEKYSKYIFGKSIKNKIKLYNKYLHVRDEKYLNWAIYNVLNWRQNEYLKNTIHIHGSEDIIFPIKYIQNSIVIEGGAHEMILTKSKKISTILQDVILNNEN